MKNLKTELLGMELTLIELDNRMMEKGYYTIFNEGVLEEVLKDGNAVYLSTEDNETEILVSFKVKFLGDIENENLGESFLEVTDIEKM